jgi:hypothetical protein
MTQLLDEKMKYGCFDKIWGFQMVKIHVLSPGVWQFYQTCQTARCHKPTRHNINGTYPSTF